MATINETLTEIMDIEGALATSIVDSTNGFMLGSKSRVNSLIDLEYASAGNTELYHAKQKIMKALNINEKIEDFLITLESQYHILMPIPQISGAFIYFVMDKENGTLALARRKLHDIALKIDF
ncbi:hypothetical protein [Kingella negevensis]|uniref:Roadblock/LC7 domain protein n=1 Tax=Kingella negevensis TaxID=1522312 RepID=A0A238HH67_9NEIS|nr:hypothetical protein [Kingella negevensis]MDK4679569.1 hypothetical protein [Kingella negevensis]MDK4682713.1 hypothetical protein [Kingella negevensis]MDK4689009.1 hypothetical protein [Kingella negevensis]MDK4690910.1 hypothetical protein [Kingella negevensis]MDK4693943.1 hypothetical protein [Kingella negevensis]